MIVGIIITKNVFLNIQIFVKMKIKSPLCRKTINCCDVWLYEKYNQRDKNFNFLDKLEKINSDDNYKNDV